MENLTGLSKGEAEKRLEKYGHNELTRKKKRSTFSILISQFTDFVVILLLIAALVSALLDKTFPWGHEESMVDAIAIVAIVLFNGIFGFIQEYKAEEAIEALKRMVSPKARVIRDGEIVVIPVKNIVPGDVIVVETGDLIPADAKLISVSNLSVNEAPLTGESVAVRKDTDEKNKIFMGTMATYGRGVAEVTGTGMNTEIGEIANLVQETEKEKTPLQEELDSVGKKLGIGAVLVSVIIFLVGIFVQQQPIFPMFLIAVALAVAAIPEGLPAIVTISLALGLQRMSKKSAVIRKLKAVETLGSANVICSDKTGTLTKNAMTVKKIYLNEKYIDVSGTGYNPEGEFTIEGKSFKVEGDLERLLRVGMLCNNSHLVNEEGRWKIIGDPTEGSLQVLAAKAGLWYNEIKEKYENIAELPFDSERKRMSTLEQHKNTKYVNCKGAPEAILGSCNRILENGKVRKITSKDKKRITKANENLTKDAFRTLGFAYKEFERKKLDVNIDEVERNLIFVGLVGMIDPPRPEVKHSIEKCKSAGIKVVMITGDHKLTAIAIAKELGIYKEGDKAFTGEDLEGMGGDDLKKVADSATVYARVSPKHKLDIMNALKEHKYIVAMTGDGVNDAPALMRSDIGVAMGITGTDVSKESADMVLIDDNFATIVSAVEEGRIIYNNIKKAVFYLVSANIGEIVTIFFATIGGLATPLLPLQLLWVNILTDGFPALALSVDPATENIMQRPPRSKESHILSKKNLMKLGFLGAIIGGVTLAMFMLYYDTGVMHARSVAFTTLVVLELILVFSIRTEEFFLKHIHQNKYLILAIIFSILLQFTALYIPEVRAVMFSCSSDQVASGECAQAALSANELINIFLASLVPIFLLEIYKVFTRKRKNYSKS